MNDIATERTICFLLRDSEVLLGMKKTGQGHGNYNGFGGKKHDGESIDTAAVRELWEEAVLKTDEPDLDKRAEIEFYFPNKPEWNQRVHVYFVRRWTGIPKETEEMKPEWFPLSNIPYDKMWDSDHYWLPMILEGKRIKAVFHWKSDNKTVDTYTINDL